MKHDTIIDKIARTIERKELGKGGITPLPFVYADRDIQNIILDTLQPPFAAAVPLSSGTAADQRGMYHDQVTLAVFFGDLMKNDTADYNARKNERIIDECKRRCFMWLASLQNNNEIELISVNGAERWYLQNDVVATGYVVNVTIKEVEGYGKCDWR